MVEDLEKYDADMNEIELPQSQANTKKRTEPAGGKAKVPKEAKRRKKAGSSEDEADDNISDDPDAYFMDDDEPMQGKAGKKHQRKTEA